MSNSIDDKELKEAIDRTLAENIKIRKQYEPRVKKITKKDEITALLIKHGILEEYNNINLKYKK